MSKVKKPAPDTHYVDGEKMRRLHPNTFELPPNSVKRNIAKGDFVKLEVAWSRTSPGPASERFWVQVTEIIGYTIHGVIDYDVSQSQHGLENGDVIEFGYRNVLDVMKGNWTSP